MLLLLVMILSMFLLSVMIVSMLLLSEKVQVHIKILLTMNCKYVAII